MVSARNLTLYFLPLTSESSDGTEEELEKKLRFFFLKYYLLTAELVHDQTIHRQLSLQHDSRLVSSSIPVLVGVGHQQR